MINFIIKTKINNIKLSFFIESLKHFDIFVLWNLKKQKKNLSALGAI